VATSSCNRRVQPSLTVERLEDRQLLAASLSLDADLSAVPLIAVALRVEGAPAETTVQVASLIRITVGPAQAPAEEGNEQPPAPTTIPNLFQGTPLPIFSVVPGVPVFDPTRPPNPAEVLGPVPNPSAILADVLASVLDRTENQPAPPPPTEQRVEAVPVATLFGAGLTSTAIPVELPLESVPSRTPVDLENALPQPLTESRDEAIRPYSGSASLIQEQETSPFAMAIPQPVAEATPSAIGEAVTQETNPWAPWLLVTAGAAALAELLRRQRQTDASTADRQRQPVASA
jgi:hypothetical protein